MSVSSRIKQYGAMRAVGMGKRQVTKMIAAEAFTYAFLGCFAGCVLGIPLNKLLFDLIIASHFSYAVWVFPFQNLAVILGFVLFAGLAAGGCPGQTDAHDFDHGNNQRFISRVAQPGQKIQGKTGNGDRKSGAVELESRSLTALLFP